MGNLVASLIAAEFNRHHQGQGQGAAPSRREVRHGGPQGGLAKTIATWSGPSSGTRTWRTSSSRRSARAAPGGPAAFTRILKLGPRPRRPAPPMAGGSSSSGGGAKRPPAPPCGAGGLLISYDVRPSRASPPSPKVPVAGALRLALEPDGPSRRGAADRPLCRPDHDAGVHAPGAGGARRPTRRTSSDGVWLAQALNRQLGRAPEVVVAPCRCGRPGLRRPPLRRRRARTGISSGTPRTPDPLLAPGRAASGTRSTWGLMRAASDVFLGHPRLPRSFCRRPVGCLRPGPAPGPPGEPPPAESIDEARGDRLFRRGTQDTRLPAFRDHRRLVLPPDGPLPGGEPDPRWAGARRTPPASWSGCGRPPPATAYPIRPRRTACA